MPKLNQGWARVFWVKANFCRIQYDNYEGRNLQKIAFERLGRQTFVDFCFIFTKIELYKNLPIDVLILDGIYVQVEAVQDLRGLETKNHSRQIFVDFYIKCSKIEIHKNLPKPQLQEVDVGWFLGKFL